MIRLTKKQIEALGYECNSFHEAVFVSASRAAPLAHRACPICGCEGGLVTGTLRVHTSDGPHEVEHRCHIECVDWPTVPVGNRMDPTHGACICDECLEARGRDISSCPELADQDQHACWSCEEFMRAAEADAYQQALERAMQAEADRIDQEQERLDDLARGARPSHTASAQAEIDRLTIEQADDLEADSLTE